ncbi:MAG: GH92 family glycosyl hydrolase, partial [Bacteroidota bacterium]
MIDLKKSNIYIIYLLLIILSLISCKKEEKLVVITDYSKYVNPFIGTGSHGHTYPGATVPFGMLQVSPDNGISKWDWCSGYHYSDSITIGFSHLHLSGTGIGDLNDIRFMPVNKKVNLEKKVITRDDIPYKSVYNHSQESAKAGYYSVFLRDHNINVELTSDKRVAFHKYTYKKDDIQSVVIDLGNAFNWDKPVETQINIEDKFTISGYRHTTGWAKNQKVFFVARFSNSIKDFDLVNDHEYIKGSSTTTGVKTSAQLFFNDLSNHEIQIKVGVSSVSIENARQNIEEYDGKFDFNAVKVKAKENWNSILSKIKIETPIDSLKTIFYTALYHTQIAPVTFSDINGEFRKENDTIYRAKGFTTYSTLSLWDTFRAEHPLLTILQPEKVSDIINSMLLYYEDRKVLPVWTLYANETNTMTGYHSIPVIAEAYLKGIRGFDIGEAYEAMKNTMMGDDRGLKYYKKFGYIPYNLLD